jgi:four helix bundle protein
MNVEGSKLTRDGKRVYDLENRLVAFAVRIMEVVEALPKSRAGNHIAGQLLRCGTSPAPNYGEAQAAESRDDFIHKLKVCLKELRETRVWLVMIQARDLIAAKRLEAIISECVQLISIFATSVTTDKRNKLK